jgi:hypothetical protein
MLTSFTSVVVMLLWSVLLLISRHLVPFLGFLMFGFIVIDLRNLRDDLGLLKDGGSVVRFRPATEEDDTPQSAPTPNAATPAVDLESAVIQAAIHAILCQVRRAESAEQELQKARVLMTRLVTLSILGASRWPRVLIDLAATYRAFLATEGKGREAELGECLNAPSTTLYKAVEELCAKTGGNDGEGTGEAQTELAEAESETC